jgi:hypothetical protein
VAGVTTAPPPREPVPSWLDALEVGAPNAVAAFRGIEAGRFISVRREVRRRAGAGSSGATVGELEALADALAAIVERLPDAALSAPGGEADWNVAQAIGHDAAARSGLALAAALAASGRWPAGAPAVVPGVAGDPDQSRDELRRRIDQSRRVIARAGRAIEGHETDPCPLEHPLVGRLRCGEWLLFAGVHDLMHLEQLHRIESAFAAGTPGRGAPPVGARPR